MGDGLPGDGRQAAVPGVAGLRAYSPPSPRKTQRKQLPPQSAKGTWGGFCAMALGKTILDGSISLFIPFSTYQGEQMHHTLRYRKHDTLTVYV